MENKVLKFKNYFLYSIVNPVNPTEIIVRSFQVWLMNLKLHGPASRMRTRFIRLVTDRTKELDVVRIKLAEEYSRNKKGEVVYVDKKGKKTTKNEAGFNFDIQDVDKFMQEWEDYLNEDYIIDVTPANNDIMNGVKAILLETTEEFEGREAVRYDEWASAFEEIWNETKKEDKTPEKELIKEEENK